MEKLRISFCKVNKKNARSIFNVEEETREIENDIFTKNVKIEVIVPPMRTPLK